MLASAFYRHNCFMSPIVLLVQMFFLLPLKGNSEVKGPMLQASLLYLCFNFGSIASFTKDLHLQLIIITS